jgi:hypothetical protein
MMITTRSKQQIVWMVEYHPIDGKEFTADIQELVDMWNQLPALNKEFFYAFGFERPALIRVNRANKGDEIVAYLQSLGISAVAMDFPVALTEIKERLDKKQPIADIAGYPLKVNLTAAQRNRDPFVAAHSKVRLQENSEQQLDPKQG